MKKTDQYEFLPGESMRTGRITYRLSIFHGEHKKLEVTAYAVQHGIKKGDTFVPYEEELFNTKSLEELTNRTTDYFPDEEGIHFRNYLDEDFSRFL